MIIILVKNRGYTLKYASERLKDNYDIVLEVVIQSPSSRVWASERLRNNYDIIAQCIKVEYLLLENISESIRYDLYFLKHFQQDSFPSQLTRLHSSFNILAKN